MPSRSHLPLYGGLLVFEWALVLLVRRLTARDVPLRELIGGRWDGSRPVVRDLLIAAGLWAVWTAAMHALNAVLPSAPNRVAGAMLPVGLLESIVWILLSLSAGFAEELAFRGYLQRRIGIVSQAIAFGVLHGYQGVIPVLRITAYGLLFGAMAVWRGSLRPGMIAHAWTDIAAGLL